MVTNIFFSMVTEWQQTSVSDDFCAQKQNITFVWNISLDVIAVKWKKNNLLNIRCMNICMFILIASGIFRWMLWDLLHMPYSAG